NRMRFMFLQFSEALNHSSVNLIKACVVDRFTVHPNCCGSIMVPEMFIKKLADKSFSHFCNRIGDSDGSDIMFNSSRWVNLWQRCDPIYFSAVRNDSLSYSRVNYCTDWSSQYVRHV